MGEEIFNYKNVDYVIVIGKDKQNNWDLLETSNPTDIWFHVADSSSSHVFLKTEEKMKDIPRAVIVRCACLCKSYSKSKATQKCSIIYTCVINVEKGKHVGEVLTKNVKTISI
jgi:predicted ribosome quality control (RQC) complex YloA/Tae2 family protein